MTQNKKIYYLIDFDSTFIKSEGLEELAALTLQHNPDKDNLLKQIKSITDKAMEGKIPFDQSLEKRLKLLHAAKPHVKKVASILKKHITPSIARNTEFFKNHKDDIYIISGGFKEFILPVVTPYGIHEDHVFANTFEFDADDNVSGVDRTNPMSQEQGKVKVVKSLRLDGDLYIIGDGYTDYQLKKLGLVKKFIAFTENIERKLIVENADTVAPSFDEFLYVNKLPMSVSYPKSRIKVLLLENIHNDALKLFESEGYSVEYSANSMSEDELREKIKNVYILGIGARTQITREILANANRLLTIGLYAGETKNINLEYASGKGISVINIPYSRVPKGIDLVTHKIIEYINTGNTQGNCTLPNIKLSKEKNSHRLLHIHNNVPGILARINIDFAEHNINILAQYLKTTEKIGYVITDVDKEYDKEVLQVLKKIPDTIRFRVLY